MKTENKVGFTIVAIIILVLVTFALGMQIISPSGFLLKKNLPYVKPTIESLDKGLFNLRNGDRVMYQDSLIQLHTIEDYGEVKISVDNEFARMRKGDVLTIGNLELSLLGIDKELSKTKAGVREKFIAMIKVRPSTVGGYEFRAALPEGIETGIPEREDKEVKKVIESRREGKYNLKQGSVVFIDGKRVALSSIETFEGARLSIGKSFERFKEGESKVVEGLRITIDKFGNETTVRADLGPTTISFVEATIVPLNEDADKTYRFRYIITARADEGGEAIVEKRQTFGEAGTGSKQQTTPHEVCCSVGYVLKDYEWSKAESDFAPTKESNLRYEETMKEIVPIEPQRINNYCANFPTRILVGEFVSYQFNGEGKLTCERIGVVPEYIKKEWGYAELKRSEGIVNVYTTELEAPSGETMYSTTDNEECVEVEMHGKDLFAEVIC